MHRATPTESAQEQHGYSSWPAMQTQGAFFLLFTRISTSNTHSFFAIQALLCCLLRARTLPLKIYNLAHNYHKHMMDIFGLGRGRVLCESYNE